MVLFKKKKTTTQGRDCPQAKVKKYQNKHNTGKKVNITINKDGLQNHPYQQKMLLRFAIHIWVLTLQVSKSFGP